MENAITRNEVVFYGTIVGIHGKDESGSMTIVCPRIIRKRDKEKFVNGMREDFPVLSFNKETKTSDILKNYSVGDKVAIKAYLHSYLRMNDRGDTTEMMNLYIDEIEHAVSKMETAFGVPGQTFPEAKNDVFLSGELIGLTKRTGRVVTLRLDVSDNNKKNHLNLLYFNAPKDFLTDYHIGDTINVLGSMQTVNTKEQKTVRNYQSIVVLDISK